MSFTSAVFALFLPAAFILYWGLPERFSAWALLLLNVKKSALQEVHLRRTDKSGYELVLRIVVKLQW